VNESYTIRPQAKAVAGSASTDFAREPALTLETLVVPAGLTATTRVAFRTEDISTGFRSHQANRMGAK
jgi:hypothetical protein